MPRVALVVDGSARTLTCVLVVPAIGAMVGSSVGGGGVNVDSGAEVGGNVAVRNAGVEVWSALLEVVQAESDKAIASVISRSGLEFTSRFYPEIGMDHGKQNRLTLRRAAGTPEQTRTALFGSGGRRSVH